MFSETFFSVLITMGLVWTALGAVTLIALLIRDWIRNELW